jgi:multicomponent K+:H+ antiporter subunit E
VKRLIPSPLLSTGLFVLWMLLAQSTSAGMLALGLVLAIFWPAATTALRPTPVRVRKPATMLRLFGRVVLAMLRANAEVARLVLTRSSRDIPSGFVSVPLDLRNPNGLAVLAMIVTFTPGTAWVQLSADGRRLLLHVLAVDDEAALVAVVKQRYERPLMEIFP